MDKKNRIILFKSICFLFIFINIFIVSTYLVKDKRRSFPDDTHRKVLGFYQEPENSLDVINIGSSHMYYGINPSTLYSNFGITSYNFAASSQPMWISYTYIKEALKYQSPKVIVLDLYGATYTDEYKTEGTNRLNIDDLKFSLNKIECINNSVPQSERLSYYLEFIKYHGNWENLDINHFKIHEGINPYKGHTLSFTSGYNSNNPNVTNIAEKADVPLKQLEYLNKIIDLCKQKEVNLIFIVTPYSINNENQKIFNTISDIASKNNIPYINYNLLYEDIGFDSKKDLRDFAHTNVYGSDKVTKHLGNFLRESYDFDDKRNYSNGEWDKTIKYYEWEKLAYDLSTEENLDNYINKLNNTNYVKIVSLKSNISKELNNKLKSLGISKNISSDKKVSYLMIMDEENKYEQCEDKSLSEAISIDNNKIIVDSENKDSIQSSSIKIDYKEYSKNNNGVNIVIYDKTLQRVIDSISLESSKIVR